MKLAWATRKLGLLADISRGSSPRPIVDTRYFEGGKIPWVKIADATKSGKFLFETKEHVNEFGASFSKRLPPGTILVAASGTLGYTQILGVEACAHDGWLILQNLRGLDRDFAYYALKTQEKHFFNSAYGAAIQNINTDILRQTEIPFPPLPVQRRIAGILTPYEEMIENCQRRIRILDEIERTLYREWFINFRFPGHKNLQTVDSPLGDIPQGWEVKKLADVAVVNRAQIKAHHAPDEIHYIDISSVSPGLIDTTTTYAFADAPGRARRVVQHGDMLWSCVRPNRRSHAQVMRPERNTIASTGFAVLTATKVPFTFLYLAATTDDFVAFLTSNATGAAYPAVTAATFEKADLLIPPAPLLKKFGDSTIPMAEQIDILRRKIQNLRRTRDLLLPRLLSGQISLDVSDVEDVAEPIVSASPLSHTEFASEEPVLRAAEEAPFYRVERAGKGLSPQAEPADEAPMPIDKIDRTEVLQVIRQVFSEGPPRERDTAIRDVARALGYRRAGPRIQEILHTDLMTAVRRCILENQNGGLRLCARSITDYDRGFLKQQFLAAIGRGWIDRDTAIHDFCRWLGFARTGLIIEDAARSLINGLLRESRLQTDTSGQIRRLAM